WIVPYGRNADFTGRKGILESMKEFSKSREHSRIALYGLGGCGKTQLALEYVHQCANESDGVFWVQGSGVSIFCEGFKAVAQHARIPLPSAEIDEEAYLRGIRKWFEGPDSGDWILVIDNADNEENFNGNTSAIAKFRAVDMILDSVSHLPLAIVGSAAFMTENVTSPSVYWTIFQENENRAKALLSKQFCDIQREVNGTESVLGTYFTTFDQITKQMPSAAGLLWLVAFFDRQNIPEQLLT
ncbi:unnamed protein product, partial [Tuber aestivum]